MKVAPTGLPSALVPAQAALPAAPAMMEAADDKRDAAPAAAALPARLDASGLFSTAPRVTPADDDRRLLPPLVKTRGTAFDLAIGEVWKEGEPHAERIFCAAVTGCIREIRPETEGLPIVDQLQNYLLRLRVIRLLMALEELPVAGTPKRVQVLYPFSGYDVLPSLFFPEVKAIDWKIEPGEAPADPKHYRDRLVRECLFRASDGTGRSDETLAVDRALRTLFDIVSAEPHRHQAIDEDVFGEWLQKRLNLKTGAARILFFKGLEWMIPPLAFMGGGKGLEREAASVWLADRLTRRGDAVALWDALPDVEAALLAGDRYARWQPSFLGQDERARLEGASMPKTQLVLEPIRPLDPSYPHLHFVIPHFLKLFRRVA